MVRLKLETRPSEGRESCERMVWRSQPPMRGPRKQERRARRELKRSSRAAEVRRGEVGDEGGEGGGAG